MSSVIEPLAAIEAAIQVGADQWLAFAHPIRVVLAESPQDVGTAIREVERLTRERGWWAIGYVAYEAGQAFGLTGQTLNDFPLVWFALFETARAREVAEIPKGPTYRLTNIQPSWSLEEFRTAFARVKAAIADGDTYQANLTFKIAAGFEGDPRALWADLVDAQQGQHSAYLAIGRHAICSASPELFFRLNGLGVTTKPMKGTARRGLTTAADVAAREALQRSPKDRAENVMIVDMMRNDLGRIAVVGSVSVPELFATERYPHIWQMTSTVTARSAASLEAIFAALHPSASVTGAPKVRTAEILRDLESGPRGVYTGAIGYVRPDGNASFSVAIRTAVVDLAAGRVEFGVGSGIVWDSDPVAEYQECLLKGAVLGRRPVAFDLLETLRWEPQKGFVLLERHLDRLEDSAAYFGRRFDRTSVSAALREALQACDDARRVRLLVNRSGEVRVEHTVLTPVTPQPLRVAFAGSPIEPDSLWLYHKTTQRQVYEAARAEWPNRDEVLLWNARGEVTEGTTTNLVIQVEDVKVTPPVSCGLLPGTFRAELLSRGEVVERAVTKAQLRSARRFWLINSVHGWRDAVLAE